MAISPEDIRLSRNHGESAFVQTFKKLLKEQNYGSQGELAQALAQHGYPNIAQAKISRLLARLGAVKMRNASNQKSMYYPRNSPYLNPNKRLSLWCKV